MRRCNGGAVLEIEGVTAARMVSRAPEGHATWEVVAGRSADIRIQACQTGAMRVLEISQVLHRPACVGLQMRADGTSTIFLSPFEEGSLTPPHPAGALGISVAPGCSAWRANVVLRRLIGPCERGLDVGHDPQQEQIR